MCESDPAAIKPDATAKDKRAWCMGSPFAGIKRTEGKKGSNRPLFHEGCHLAKGLPMCLARPRSTQSNSGRTGISDSRMKKIGAGETEIW